MYFNKFGALRLKLQVEIFSGGALPFFLGVLVYAVFKTFLKTCTRDLSRQRAHRGHRVQPCILVRFLSKMVRFWSDFQVKLVR